VRIFRGSLPRGIGPFTKELSYIRGFIDIADLIRKELFAGRIDRIPLLFAGKMSAGDLDDLSWLADRGLLARPRFVPAQFHNAQLLGRLSQSATGPFPMAA
jgi:hypothetical protein